MMILAQILPKASDLPDTQLTLLAFVFAGVFLLGWLLTRAFSSHLTKVMDKSSAESEKDRQLHREVSHGLIQGLQGVTLSVGGLKDDIGKHGRRIDKLAVAITGKLAEDDDSNG